MLGHLTSARRQDVAEIPVSLASGDSYWVGCRWRMTQDQAGLRVHGTKTMWFASET
jgi:hypothetical protein